MKLSLPGWFPGLLSGWSKLGSEPPAFRPGPEMARHQKARHPGLAEAQALGARLPALLVAAERVAATVAQGVHGRRRAGMGDSFWQYRQAMPGEPASRCGVRMPPISPSRSASPVCTTR